MQRLTHRRLVRWACAVTALCAASCGRDDALQEPSAPPLVTISRPVRREVTDFAVFTGRTEAVNSVEIKARVTGYLKQAPFKEGSEVAANAMLFEIDPRSYQAQFDAAAGQLKATQAKYELAKTENERAKALYAENPRAISQKALDQHQAAEDSAKADVEAARSSMQVYKVNLDFTRIHSPIAGRVGRQEVTPGNLVTENVTSLTTVVSQDPVYAYFDVDEQTMLQVLRGIFEGQLPTITSRKVPVSMALQDEEGFPHEGTVDFANNAVDPSTGTLTVRGEFANPANSAGVRLLMPGLFVRVRLPLDRPKSAVLVADRAVGTDQGQKFLYVLDEAGAVEYRRVTLGALQDDGLRVVESGLGPDDRVVVDGLQLVRPGTKPRTRQRAMSSDGRSSDATPSIESPADSAVPPEAKRTTEAAGGG